MSGFGFEVFEGLRGGGMMRVWSVLDLAGRCCGNVVGGDGDGE